MKICIKCLQEKSILDFNKDKRSQDGYRSHCKECRNKIKKKYRETHKTEIQKAAKTYYKNNKEKLKAQISEYQRKKYAKTRDKLIQKTMEWKRKNPDKVAAARKRYNKSRRIQVRISTSIHNALKIRGSSKAGQKTWGEILNYTVEDLKKHLELQFESGMSWSNYGVGPDKWSIDHIVPDSHFTYSSIKDEGFQRSWSLENLQPMWFNENSSKGNRYSGKHKKETPYLAPEL